MVGTCAKLRMLVGNFRAKMKHLGNSMNKQHCPLSLSDLFKITSDLYALKTADYIINFAYISLLKFCWGSQSPPGPLRHLIVLPK